MSPRGARELMVYALLAIAAGALATYALVRDTGPEERRADPDGAMPPRPDAGVDAGRCGFCPPERPHCDEAEGMCVACEEREHCAPPLSACMNGRCVACETSHDCADLGAAECYFGDHACRPCTSDDACLFRIEAPHCVEGRCAP